MNPSEISENFTPLDRSVLVGEKVYQDYFEYLQFALKCLIDSFDSYKSDQPHEVAIIKSFSQRFLNTVKAFMFKYTFNDTHPMLVDVTESGFPNYLEFKRLNDDLNRREIELKKSQSVETLKMFVLDHLIKNQSHPEKLLKQISLRSYYEQLDANMLFTEFTDGGLKLLKNQANSRRFLYSWGSFDSVTNRPYIYILLFDNILSESDTLTNQDFKEKIKRITHNTAPLKVMISDIDEMHNDVHPKVLKRIDIGPIFGKYSRDEHPYTLLLKDHFEEEDFIFTYDSEVIFSVGEKRNKSFLSKGELRQIFYIDESNKECMEKMISKIHKYKITSHDVWQHLAEYHKEKLKELAARPYIYSKD